MESGSLLTLIAETAEPARIEDYARETGVRVPASRASGSARRWALPSSSTARSAARWWSASGRAGAFDTGTEAVVRLTQRLIELGKDNWELSVYPLEDHGFYRT